MLKRTHLTALGLVIVLTLVLLNLPHHAATQIKLAIGGLFLPLFGLSKSGSEAAAHAGNALTPRSELLRELDALRRTNQVLQLRAVQADALERQNNEFRQLFGWQQQSPWKDRLRLGSVVARDTANWWETIQIDLGSRNGVKPDQAVLSPDGHLVGRISTVSLTRSEVILVGNPNCRVAVAIPLDPKNSEQGVITRASSTVDRTLVTLSFLSRNSRLKPGQVAYTSGSGVLPRGIPVGLVSEEPKLAEQGFDEVRIKLGADPGGLEEVWVLLQ